MNKYMALLSITAFICGQALAMDRIQQLNQQLAVETKTANYQQVEKLIGHGASATSVGHDIVSTLKYNGFHANKHSEKLNKYYMTLRILKQHGVWIGQPNEGNVFGDPVLDGDLGIF